MERERGHASMLASIQIRIKYNGTNGKEVLASVVKAPVTRASKIFDMPRKQPTQNPIQIPFPS
eukprot:scaffold208_cov248-Chaetoceros_neogracile.AAC.8